MKLALYTELERLFQQGHTTEDLRERYQSVVPSHSLDGVEQRVAQATGRRRIWKFEGKKIAPAKLLDLFMTRWQEEAEAQEGEAAAGRVDLIERMAMEHGRIPPCFLARLLVKAYAESQRPRPISCDIDDLEASEEAPCREAASASAPGPKGAKTAAAPPPPGERQHISAAKWYRTPALIPHAGLAANVQHCHQVDKYYSPAMDEFRNRIGRLYEERLNECLNALGVVYLDEPRMRKMGYARTPDAVLSEPIAVAGRVVKWIESKAWFGDPPSHASYLRDQYWPYYNRFGPGLVIYWFGFVEESVAGHLDRGVAVMEDFPDLGTITRIASPLEPLVRLYAPRESAAETPAEMTWPLVQDDDTEGN